MRYCFYIITCFIIMMSCLPTHAAENLFLNGDLQAGSTELPAKWGLKPEQGVTCKTQGDNRFLRLTSMHPGKTVLTYREFYFNPDDAGRFLRLSFKMRCNDLQRGEKPWFVGTLFIQFVDDNNKKLSPGVRGIPRVKGTMDWQDKSVDMVIPDKAVKLQIMPVLFNVKSGTMDMDDFSLQYISAMGEKYKPAPKQRAHTAVFPVNGGKPHPLELKVVGNQVINSAGKEVWLQGINIPSLGWSAKGEQVFTSTVVAIDEWHANVIRLAVRHNFWFGESDYQNDGGKAYRELVDKLVEATASRGAYLLLDLHEFKAIQPKHLRFWEDAAKRYANHPAVIFGLFNEPHSISWDVWKNGGQVKEKIKAKDGVAAENKLDYKTFESPGIQKCMDVIRQTGAKNVCTVSGLDWAATVAGVLEGYDIVDNGGNGIIYEAHCYNWKKDWQGHFLDTAKKYPVLMGELGADIKPMDFLPKEIQEDPYTWAPDFLGCVQKHKLHWTAWCFHTNSTPRMLSDWDFTPTPFCGQFAKDALSGKPFEMKKMR
ncbi:MAG: endoglucanase [Phycisphaeraceae bacterium]|nr:endoglucanase [Phycisphaeraceae bacterium]